VGVWELKLLIGNNKILKGLEKIFGSPLDLK
jgi:hypothetical protein